MTNKALLLVTLVLACLGAGFAQSDIVYVAYNGLDTHPCTRPAPCQTITHALSVVNAGGQVSIIGSGTYDNFIISKSVTVAAEPGVIAVLDVTTTFPGVYIAAGTGDSVVVRGLNVYGGPGSNGIGIAQVGEASIEDCVSRSAWPLVVDGYFSFVRVKGGLYATPPGGYIALDLYNEDLFSVPKVAIDGVTIEGADFGLWINASLVTITNSVLSGTRPGTGGAGIYVSSGTVISENNVISNYDSGVDPAGGPVYLSSNTIAGNTTGVNAANGMGSTRGNNTIAGNGQNVNGTMAPFSGQ